MIETRQITGLPSREDAERRIRIWKVTSGAIPGTDTITHEGSTWTASMDFDLGEPDPVPALAATPADPPTPAARKVPAKTAMPKKKPAKKKPAEKKPARKKPRRGR
ncbi:MAG: hypothetical protein KF787_04310 [Phycisphaeraceae bacterium]|nr:hypothetical protein [Phycisphaerae bacterium]MBX3391850.1 hypothetical protein [Phycisphaeraceae bacterium]